MRRIGSIALGLAAAGSLTFRSADGQAAGQRRLAGRWTITLQIDSLQTGSGAAATRSLTGTVVVVSMATSEPPTYRGTYQIPFSTIGLSPDAAPILARVGRDDSVRIVLNPTVDSGNVEMVGGWSRGGLEGRWEWTGSPAKAWGRFTMRGGPH